MQKEQFGRLLVFLRKQRKMSQKELAAALSVSPSAVSKWEHGSNLPDVAMLDEIALLLEVSCDELLHPERTLERMDPDAAEIQEEPRPAEGRWEEKRSEWLKKSASVAGRQDLKGKWRKLALAAAAMALLGVLGIAPWLIFSSPNAGGDDFRLFATRYTEDTPAGKSYEIAFVTSGERDRVSIHRHMDRVREQYRQGREVDADTRQMRVYYYDNEADAAEWLPVNFGGIIYFADEKN